MRKSNKPAAAGMARRYRARSANGSAGEARRYSGMTMLAAAVMVCLAATAVWPAQTLAAVSTSSGIQPFCNWTFAALDSPPADGQARPEIVDLDSGYWELYFGTGFPVGTTFKIRGRFPQARYFSFTVTNDVTKSLQTVASLADYQIVPDAGSRSPYTAVNVVDPGIPAGGSYTLDMVLAPAPAAPAPNTLYLNPAQFTGSTGIASLTYRIYDAAAGISVAQHGGEPLPSLSEVTPRGEIPLSQLLTPPVCQLDISLSNATADYPAQWLDALFAQPEAPNPIPAYPGLPGPAFALRDPNSTTDLSVNPDARYIYSAGLTQFLGDLVLVRMLAPSYATSAAGGTDPQLRYWSLCEGSFLETYACVADREAVIDAEGYVNLVVSVPGKQPSTADAKHGFNWLTYGTTAFGVLTYRQILPAPDFAHSAFNVVGNASPQSVMGNYFPQSTYCSNAVFAAHTAAAETPAQVFAACKAGK
ncbi:MAG: hypothetical protein P4L83_12990 [Nevskia sp.]|nr:hypothetical protein [Nevskia sp.]